ncbi:hypothetical protein [Paenibacillus nasutitermitis]|uniref:Hydroxymethylpyrimidine pyrophosphatase n=1 Tax=Paenibacillus nasutitermitis TaxID=1652958 RepID=A0A917DM68_9BACL|nr:hypothetical protein [Paenibacillus nasutitermitis]GGD50637.1 hypothetical protein GCM10010911_05240 [Paenibacillus nasutitermitis]
MNPTQSFPRLFVTDLDGTVLGGGFRPYSRIPDVVCKFLDRLDGYGCKWMTNTAWEAKPQIDLIAVSAMMSCPLYVSGSVGLELCQLRGEKLTEVQPYSAKLREQLMEVQCSVLHSFVQEICGRFESEFILYNGFWFALTPVEGRLEEMYAYLQERQPQLPEISIQLLAHERRFYSHPAFLTKDLPIREAMRLHGWTPDQIVVAGDELPDLHMMDPEVAKHAICPGNAHPDVKRRVIEMGGVVGQSEYGLGVVQAFEELAVKNGWS